MPPKRTMIGIGDAVWAVTPDGQMPMGSAAGFPVAAARLGENAITIARIGQDETGEQLRAALEEAGVDTGHLQYDPDLTTARLTVQRIGSMERRTLSPYRAFDNLQWDFDLEDEAQTADVVVLSDQLQQDGQGRSTVDRFLAECRSALRVLDLSYADDNADRQPLDRSQILTTLQSCEAVIASRKTLHALVPRQADRPDQAMCQALLRETDGMFVVIGSRQRASNAGDDQPVPLMIVSRDEQVTAGHNTPPLVNDSLIAGLLHHLLAGRNMHDSLQSAVKVADFAREHPKDEIPDELRAG